MGLLGSPSISITLPSLTYTFRLHPTAQYGQTLCTAFASRMRGAFSRLSLLNGCTLEPISITSDRIDCARTGSGSKVCSCIEYIPLFRQNHYTAIRMVFVERFKSLLSAVCTVIVPRFKRSEMVKQAWRPQGSPLLYDASPPFSCIVVGLHSSETLAVAMLHCVVGRCRITARRQPGQLRSGDERARELPVAGWY